MRKQANLRLISRFTPPRIFQFGVKNREGRDADWTQHQRRRGWMSIRRARPEPEQQIDA